MATVGENFKRLRLQRKLTQEQVFEALGFRRMSNVSLLERSKRLPTARTIQKMAAALGCEPRELLENVRTPWDVLRDPIRGTGVSESDTRRRETLRSPNKRDGRALAQADPTDQGDPLPPARRPSARAAALAAFKKATQALKDADARTARRSTAVAGGRGAASGARVRKPRR